MLPIFLFILFLIKIKISHKNYNLMLNYNFRINKDICFLFWAQSLINWRWNFDKLEYQYYFSFFESWTNEELNSLNELKIILQGKDVQFLLLIEQQKVNKDILNRWQNIKNILTEKFNIIWEKELPKLQSLQATLQTHSFNSSDDLLIKMPKVANFFNVDLEIFNSITVQLVLYYSKNLVAGHAHKSFSDLIILKTSNLEHRYSDEAINVLLHETVHLIKNKSPQSNILLKNSYFKIRFKLFYKRIISLFYLLIKSIKHLAIKEIKEGTKKIMKFPSWSYFFTESVITSIAAGSGKINTYFRPNILQKIEKFDYLKNVHNYTAQNRAVALRLVPLTIYYLDNNKIIDQNYCDEVAKIWLEIYNNR